MIMKPMRGDMYIAEMRQAKGSEQAGCRPVVIVQNDTGNRYSPTTIIVPLTAKHKSSLPTHVKIKHNELKCISTALCEQVTTISKERLIRHLGCLKTKDMNKIDDALKTSLKV